MGPALEEPFAGRADVDEMRHGWAAHTLHAVSWRSPWRQRGLHQVPGPRPSRRSLLYLVPLPCGQGLRPHRDTAQLCPRSGNLRGQEASAPPGPRKPGISRAALGAFPNVAREKELSDRSEGGTSGSCLPRPLPSQHWGRELHAIPILVLQGHSAAVS